MMDCFRKGIALVNCGKSVIRLMPPLAITQDLVDKSLDVLDASICCGGENSKVAGPT